MRIIEIEPQLLYSGCSTWRRVEFCALVQISLPVLVGRGGQNETVLAKI